jgi:hypothetical protein
MPYSRLYEPLFLAYIAGLSAYGLIPTAAIADPSSTSQLDRILKLMAASKVSVHELSWMGTDRRAPRTPHFNMPFELGLAVALKKYKDHRHEWFVFDTVPHRLNKALSDLAGVQARVHKKTPATLFTEIMNAFSRRRHKPTLEILLSIFADVQSRARAVKRELGSSSLFANRAFAELVIAASDSAHRHITSLRGR